MSVFVHSFQMGSNDGADRSAVCCPEAVSPDVFVYGAAIETSAATNTRQSYFLPGLGEQMAPSVVNQN